MPWQGGVGRRGTRLSELTRKFPEDDGSTGAPRIQALSSREVLVFSPVQLVVRERHWLQGTPGSQASRTPWSSTRARGLLGSKVIARFWPVASESQSLSCSWPCASAGLGRSETETLLWGGTRRPPRRS